MGFLNEIGAHVRQEFCQSGETGLLEFVFQNIGTTNKFAVEFGASDGCYLSNIRYFLNNGWNGIQMDYDTKESKEVKKEFITKENICDLFKKYLIPEKPDLLSIDLDGNDYWILKEILKSYLPRVVILELNPAFEGSVAIEYNEKHIWNEDNYYGASFEAFKKLMEGYGYNLVYNHIELNLIFIKKEIIENEEKPLVIHKQTHCHKPHTGGGKWVNV